MRRRFFFGSPGGSVGRTGTMISSGEQSSGEQSSGEQIRAAESSGEQSRAAESRAAERGSRTGQTESPSSQGGYRRARFGQGRALAVLASVAAREPLGGAGRFPLAPCGSGRLRALSCPSLDTSVARGRGRWGGGCPRRGLEARVTVPRAVEEGADIGTPVRDRRRVPPRTRSPRTGTRCSSSSRPY